MQVILLYAAAGDTSLEWLCESFLLSDEVTPSADVPLAHSMAIRPCGDCPVGRHRFGFTGRRGKGGCESNEYRVCGIITAEAYDFSFGHCPHPQGLKRSDPQSADVFVTGSLIRRGNDTAFYMDGRVNPILS